EVIYAYVIIQKSNGSLNKNYKSASESSLLFLSVLHYLSRDYISICDITTCIYLKFYVYHLF
ncbi:hypothetical protein, partial [Escherichia coli]|uniref:hypothetical protein n=1 Tax=Escherichia coli TaxID=562 RepID=UPI0030C6B715